MFEKNKRINMGKGEYYECRSPDFTDFCDNGVIFLGQHICQLSECHKYKWRPDHL